MQIDSTPFEKIRFRALVGFAILATITAFISISILTRFLPEWFKSEPSPLREILTVLLMDLFFLLFIFRRLSHSGLSYNRLCGASPAWQILGRYSLWAVPLVIVSITSVYLLFFPLSFLFPGFVKSWLFGFSPTAIWTSGSSYMLANVLNFLYLVLIAPILEEFFFRGILLTRWTVKWSVVKAVIASSVVFAVLHTDLIGSFCFGCVMAVLYIRTKSLFIPAVIHIANNGIAWILEFLTIPFDSLSGPQTIIEFQDSWWVGLIGLVVGIPFVIYFWKHYIRDTDWQVPYFTEPAGCENNANLSD